VGGGVGAFWVSSHAPHSRLSAQPCPESARTDLPPDVIQFRWNGASGSPVAQRSVASSKHVTLHGRYSLSASVCRRPLIEGAPPHRARSSTRGGARSACICFASCQAELDSCISCRTMRPTVGALRASYSILTCSREEGISS